MYYPLSCLSGVEDFLDQLGAEFRRRLVAAGVQGGLKALAILNQLLFSTNPASVFPAMDP